MSARPFDFAAAGRRGAERRWAAHRAQRLAAGLPATTREAQGRKPDRFDDPEVERFWMQRAEACGLFDERDTSTQRRRKAHRFAAAETDAYLSAFATASGAAAAPSDRDVMLAYHEREIERLTEARRIALRNAETHLRVRGDHEKALADLIEAGAE
ncbi:hypothetical protein [Microbacterium sp. Leaf179]|jgi:hypothetical protein|uniref:hypothetical protein n=1 Tax=Microbacterium sp. Leaf179 TaxID=1736288 RepID=UPI0006FCFBED|nr:hypothetical protein [Microbacterium sp. Leaf179]KQR86511.1 hypothetical protein ASF96_09100 [Microbacterium sp. Leaf179]